MLGVEIKLRELYSFLKVDGMKNFNKYVASLFFYIIFIYNSV